jgi:hypothetical protein
MGICIRSWMHANISGLSVKLEVQLQAYNMWCMWSIPLGGLQKSSTITSLQQMVYAPMYPRSTYTIWFTSWTFLFLCEQNLSLKIAIRCQIDDQHQGQLPKPTQTLSLWERRIMSFIFVEVSQLVAMVWNIHILSSKSCW